jgi:amidase
VVVRDFDRARTAADAADAALSRGEQRPLLGLPMTVKEQFNIAGLPTTWGYEKFRNWRPESDALAVQRLKAAGAIILGKTNVPAGLNDWQSYNDVYGTTNNPWDLSRTPGGSSGGAAAALAAGFVPLELGSDIGGSLRAPAHFCGVFAHKPSVELIPQRGSGPPETPATPTRGDMAVIGPMARSAADLALQLQVLAGPDDLWDGIGYKLELPPPRHDAISDFRVLVVDEHPLCPTAESVRRALENLTGRLTTAGCKVSRTSRNMPDMVRGTRNYVELLSAFMAADLTAEQRARYDAASSALSPDNLSLEAAWTRGATMTHAAWIQTARIREGLRVRWQALFREFDVVLCPAMPTPAFRQPLDQKARSPSQSNPYNPEVTGMGDDIDRREHRDDGNELEEVDIEPLDPADTGEGERLFCADVRCVRPIHVSLLQVQKIDFEDRGQRLQGFRACCLPSLDPLNRADVKGGGRRFVQNCTLSRRPGTAESTSINGQVACCPASLSR